MDNIVTFPRSASVSLASFVFQRIAFH